MEKNKKWSRTQKKSSLEGFVPYKFKTIPTVTFAYYGATFNSGMLIGMGNPEYVQILLDRVGKRLAVKPCQRSSKNSLMVSYSKHNAFWRVNHQDFQNTVSKMMGWDFRHCTYRIYGEYVAEENSYIFHLATADSK